MESKSRTHLSQRRDTWTGFPAGNTRKGISPLIAAVLLIAFTMAVATISGPWITNLLQNTQVLVITQLMLPVPPILD